MIQRRRRDRGRGEPHVGEVVGVSGAAPRQPALRRVDRRGRQECGRTPISASCATMNDDASTLRAAGLHPLAAAAADPYSTSPTTTRRKPSSRRTSPSRTTRSSEYVTDFLQAAHEADERYTARDGINIARYALKRLKAGARSETDAALRDAVRARPGPRRASLSVSWDEPLLPNSGRRLELPRADPRERRAERDERRRVHDHRFEAAAEA